MTIRPTSLHLLTTAKTSLPPNLAWMLPPAQMQPILRLTDLTTAHLAQTQTWTTMTLTTTSQMLKMWMTSKGEAGAARASCQGLEDSMLGLTACLLLNLGSACSVSHVAQPLTLLPLHGACIFLLHPTPMRAMLARMTVQVPWYASHI